MAIKHSPRGEKTSTNGRRRRSSLTNLVRKLFGKHDKEEKEPPALPQHTRHLSSTFLGTGTSGSAAYRFTNTVLEQERKKARLQEQVISPWKSSSAPVPITVLARTRVGSCEICNICTNCDRSYLCRLSSSTNFCSKDCKTAWSLRTGYRMQSTSNASQYHPTTPQMS